GKFTNVVSFLVRILDSENRFRWSTKIFGNLWTENFFMHRFLARQLLQFGFSSPSNMSSFVMSLIQSITVTSG
ncbi:hypothetical protein NP569_27770, partial [Vibrio parahaemolyticus]|nr:hypothetical protein [Vibrio parahaemolyticus]